MAVNTYDVDPVHTFIGFAVRYLAISKVQGRFKRFGGLLEIDWAWRATVHASADAPRRVGVIAADHGSA